MTLKCTSKYKALLLKNFCIYYKYKLFFGTAATMLFTLLFLALRVTIAKNIVALKMKFPLIRLPDNESIYLTYISQLCGSFHQELFMYDKINLSYSELLEFQILQFEALKLTKKDIFADLASNKIDEIDLLDICLPKQYITELADILEMYKMNFFGKSYDATKFKRCMNYFELDNIMYQTAKTVSSIHFLSSRAIPVFFKTKNSIIETNLESSIKYAEFDDTFYDEVETDKIIFEKQSNLMSDDDSGDLVEDKVKSSQYDYCFDSTKIRFYRVDKEEKIKAILDDRHDVFFGLIIEDNFEGKNITRIRFVSRFENLVGPEDHSLGYIYDVLPTNNKYAASAQIYIQHMLDRIILVSKNDPNHNFFNNLSDNFFTGKYPYKDPDNINSTYYQSLILNLIYLFGFCLLPVSGILIYAISKERHSNLDLHFGQIGINWLDYSVTWIIFSLAITILAIIFVFIMIKAMKILIYTQYSSIIIYSLSFSLSAIINVLLMGILTRSFALNFLIYMISLIIQSFIGFFPPHLPYPYQDILSIFPYVNVGVFLNNQSEFEIRNIVNGLGVFNNKIFDDSVTSLDLVIFNLISAAISASLFFLLNYCFMNHINCLKCCNSINQKFKSHKKSFITKNGLDVKDQSESFDFQSNSDIEPVITIRGLNKSYGNLKVISNMNLKIPKNKTSILLGKNGCGKTTLINSILGCTPIDSGQIIFENRIDSSKNKVSYAPQYDPLYSCLTFDDHFLIYGTAYGQDLQYIKSNAKKWAKIFGMENFRNVEVHKYSGGMRRKLTIALTFANDSQAVFLDEPTSSIDPIARSDIWNIIDSLTAMKTYSIVICTHTPKEADMLGQYYIIMDNGLIKSAGMRSDVFNAAKLNPKLTVYFSDNDTSDVEQEVSHRDQISDNFDCEIELNNSSTVIATLKNSLNLEELKVSVKKINNMNNIQAFSFNEASSKDLFMKIVPPDDEFINIDKINAEKGLSRKINSFTKLSNQFLSQIYKISMQFFTCSHIFIFIILPIAIGLIFFGITYLSKNGYFDINEIPYTLQAVPGALIRPLTSSYKQFETFEYINDPNISQTSEIYRFKQFLLEEGLNYNVHCDSEFDQILESESQAKCEIMKSNNFSDNEGEIDEILNENFSKPTAIGGFYYKNLGTPEYNFAILYFGAQSRKSSPIILNHFSNLILKFNSEKRLVDQILLESEVYDPDKRPKLSEDIFNLILAESMTFTAFMLPTFLSLFIFREKKSNLKHLLKIEGLPMFIYWLAIFLFYTTIFSIDFWLLCSFFKMFPGEPILGQSLYPIMSLQTVYIISALPTMFFFIILLDSEFFVSASFVYSQVVFGTFLASIMSVLEQMNQGNPDYFAKKFIKYFYLPPFRYVVTILNMTYSSTDATTTTFKIFNDFSWHIGEHFIYFLIIFICLIIYEHFDDIAAKFAKSKSKNESDMLMETVNLSKNYYKNPCQLECCCIWLCMPDCLKHKIFNKKRIIAANKNISIKVNRNESHAIVGLNGAGKTTFFDMITNKEKPSSGKIYLDGLILSDPKNMDSKIGYCPQVPACLDSLTLEQHLYLIYMIKGVKPHESKNFVSECLKFYSCESLRDKKPNQMSGGGKKRLALSIINPTGSEEFIPKIFMLDEAIAALDMSSQEMVKKYMKDIVEKANRTVLFSTHYFNEIEEFAEKITVLKKGEVFFDGKIGEFYNLYKTMLSLIVRFIDDFDENTKISFAETLEKNYEMLKLRHYYANQIHFSIDIDSENSKESIPEIIDDILVGMISLESKIVENSSNENANNFIVGVSCGPFDLEQSFCNDS